MNKSMWINSPKTYIKTDKLTITNTYKYSVEEGKLSVFFLKVRQISSGWKERHKRLSLDS